MQVELHPLANHCRESLAASLGECITRLHNVVTEQGLQIDFSRLVTVRLDELTKLSDHAKFLGCTPSFNFYGRPMRVVNGLEYRRRSGAGHIHLGSEHIDNGRSQKRKKRLVKPERLVPALDILTGIPSVLIDRDEGNIERRKLYGKAGEYRLPKYGLEYRTLSNFWLRDYAIASFVWAQARTSLAAAFTETQAVGRFWLDDEDNLGDKFLSELIAKADLKRVEKAINKNDADLAYKVYDEAVKPLMKLTDVDDGLGPNATGGLDTFALFEHFISKGIDHWFTHDSATHWEQQYHGWETFLKYIVYQDMKKMEKKK